MKILLSLNSDILLSATKSKDADDAIDIEMQSDMLIILSSLCENEIHRKELFGSEGHGIQVVTHYLRMDPGKFTSGLGHHRLMLSTVDAVWYVTSYAESYVFSILPVCISFPFTY